MKPNLHSPVERTPARRSCFIFSHSKGDSVYEYHSRETQYENIELLLPIMLAVEYGEQIE